MMTAPHQTLGPILFLDGIADGRLHLAALFVTPAGADPGDVVAAGTSIQPVELTRDRDRVIWRARFALPADRPAWYAWNGTRFDLASDLTGDIRVAYVSCNGEEHGDLDRNPAERNALWARLGDEHRARPFSLLLHGGDQVYADEATEGHSLSQGWPGDLPRDTTPAQLADLRAHLRARFFDRYLALYAAPAFAWIAARVPSLMQWDDHDICDGWGSLRRGATRSAVGQTLFSVAREAALIFQHAATDGDLPARFHDARGRHLGWVVEGGGLRLIAPDLRSERTRRAILSDDGWRMIEAEATRAVPGHTFLLSSVPLLGPRLSLLETAMMLAPRMQKYEDDLRDQWQSRAHRDSWRRMLRLVRDMAQAEGHDITALSGEIHLAARAQMDLGGGRSLHQLIASGIAHRAPPRAWARVLGALSMLGEAPLPEHPIRIRRIPGQSTRYVAERNFLTLSRRSGTWQARWFMESTGLGPALAL